MTKPLKTQINESILDAALNKEPVFDAFKRLCKTRGNRKMDYVDFEWKYYQYYHGNRDLTIERNPENSSKLTFSDLPIFVLQKVVQPLVLSERLRLRKVSSGVRNMVDSTEGNCRHLELLNYGNTIPFEEYLAKLGIKNLHEIAFEDFQIKYVETRRGSCCIESLRGVNLKRHRTNRNPREVLQTDFLAILKNPRLKIDRLEIGAYAELLKPLGFQLDVRSIEILPYEEKDIRPILELVKPGCLEEIKMGAHRLTLDQLNEIGETEQWKRVKRLEWGGVPNEFPIEKMLHFKEIKIGAVKFTDDNLLQVKNLLLQSDRLELCRLVLWVRSDQGTLDRFLNQDPLFDSQSRRFSIPDARHYFQLKVDREYFNGLSITKVSKI